MAISVKGRRRFRPSKDFVVFRSMELGIPLIFSYAKKQSKRAYIKKYIEIDILYLWEADLLTAPSLCEALIKLYISSGGKLKNYHSFNYSFRDENLILNQELIIPFQERTTQIAG